VPETRLERGVFILGVLAIAALGFLVVHLWHSPRGAAPSPGTATLRTLTRTSPTTSPTQSTAPATTASSTTLARTTTSAVTAPATGAVSLVIRARVDTWIEVRSASSTGRVLYSGTLAAASSKTFHARSLWARFGSAGNLAARLDGKPVPLPSGTYDATFDAGHGFRPQRG
jgi:cytoskeletal protein RodZ